ncbi:MAG: carboxypeptidase-like regulatory domain-containing protein [Gemmatimonadota bacterium]|jgi:hypothetical protein|nr:carboxypeptidase-like regulatory domain-containing protein [Gemmatimonadota bacterium]
MKPIHSTVSVLLALGTAACSAGSPGAGKIVGDAYLVLDSGEEINLVGIAVRLVRENAEIDSVLARICVERDRELARRRQTGDSIGVRNASERAWQERERVLGGRSRRTVTTSPEARFAIDSVPAGRYRLWAEATANGTRWSWLHRVRIRAGDSIRVNLSNANIDDNPFRCQ